ncbi:hypothetical protein DCO48_03495 [Pseudomonas sp. SDI]|uniref:hypothetical protein n=1 Tax=Pseudomonas sp. SDI TaxID=2170734 RepID=UPI000DE6CA76|nr:hypothetical protein DCO48_03495 [Pseudomonas sp. SDI]
MRPALLLALTLLAANSMAQPAAEAPVTVDYIHPEKFRDARLDSSGYNRGADAYVMKQLAAELQKLGGRYLNGSARPSKVDTGRPRRRPAC